MTYKQLRARRQSFYLAEGRERGPSRRRRSFDERLLLAPSVLPSVPPLGSCRVTRCVDACQRSFTAPLADRQKCRTHPIAGSQVTMPPKGARPHAADSNRADTSLTSAALDPSCPRPAPAGSGAAGDGGVVCRSPSAPFARDVASPLEPTALAPSTPISPDAPPSSTAISSFESVWKFEDNSCRAAPAQPATTRRAHSCPTVQPGQPTLAASALPPAPNDHPNVQTRLPASNAEPEYAVVRARRRRAKRAHPAAPQRAHASSPDGRGGGGPTVTRDSSRITAPRARWKTVGHHAQPRCGWRPLLQPALVVVALAIAVATMVWHANLVELLSGPRVDNARMAVTVNVCHVLTSAGRKLSAEFAATIARADAMVENCLHGVASLLPVLRAAAQDFVSGFGK